MPGLAKSRLYPSHSGYANRCKWTPESATRKPAQQNDKTTAPHPRVMNAREAANNGNAMPLNSLSFWTKVKNLNRRDKRDSSVALLCQNDKTMAQHPRVMNAREAANNGNTMSLNSLSFWTKVKNLNRRDKRDSSFASLCQNDRYANNPTPHRSAELLSREER